ncbi:hypothetical protein SDC9_132495 [bioreactor metagenome]|uniref:Uncharacterized protein n=1 Tax=bioreactor metagenome TaxID=1076179 RepID=A0A645D7U0_9ZZZZ
MNFLHHQLDESVVNQHPAAFKQLGGQIFIGDGHPALVSRHLVRRENELRAGQERHRAGGKGFDPDFRPLGVQNGGYGPAKLVAHPTKLVEQGQVGLMRAVGEVEPGGVHTAQNQCPQGFLIVYGRT